MLLFLTKHKKDIFLIAIELVIVFLGVYLGNRVEGNREREQERERLKNNLVFVSDLVTEDIININKVIEEYNGMYYRTEYYISNYNDTDPIPNFLKLQLDQEIESMVKKGPFQDLNPKSVGFDLMVNDGTISLIRSDSLRAYLLKKYVTPDLRYSDSFFSEEALKYTYEADRYRYDSLVRNIFYYLSPTYDSLYTSHQGMRDKLMFNEELLRLISAEISEK